jgi:hypothetical protein
MKNEATTPKACFVLLLNRLLSFYKLVDIQEFANELMVV